MDEHTILAGVERCLGALLFLARATAPVVVCVWRAVCFLIGGALIAGVIILDAVVTEPEDRRRFAANECLKNCR